MRMLCTTPVLHAQVGFTWCWASLPPMIEHWSINMRSAAVSAGLITSYCAQTLALAISGQLLCAAQMWLLAVTVFTCTSQLVRRRAAVAGMRMLQNGRFSESHVEPACCCRSCLLLLLLLPIAACCCLLLLSLPFPRTADWLAAAA